MDSYGACSWSTTRGCLGFPYLERQGILCKECREYHGAAIQTEIDSIGNLFNAKDLPRASERTGQNNASESDIVVLDQIVSVNFFWNTRLKSDVHRGPFGSSKEWLNARIQLLEEDFTDLLGSPAADKDDNDEVERAQLQLKRLQKRLADFSLSNANDREEFTLHHNDISKQNLVLDAEGKLQALVDWECVSAVPLWKACQIPCFLDTPKRTQKPDPKNYALDSDEEEEKYYLKSLYDYECTFLRECFLEEMATLAPEWIVEYERSKSKVDFYLALQRCNGHIGSWRVRTWLDRIEAGGEYRRILED